MSVARTSLPPRAPRIAAPGDTDALFAEIEASLAALRRLFEHQRFLAPAEIAVLRSTVERVEKRLAREELRVVVVGEKGAGKTTFVDAIIGDRTLGEALTGHRVVTLIRNGPAATYRATFASGGQEDFARRVPDRKADIAERLAAAEGALSVATQEAEESAALAQDRKRNVQTDEHERTRAFSAVEHARDAVDHVRGEAAIVERAAFELDKQIRELEQVIPTSIHSPPPWWAVWSWLLVVFYAIFRRDVWQTYALAKRERDEVMARLPDARKTAAEALDASVQSEHRLGELGAHLAEHREAALAAANALADAERVRDHWQAEVARLRAELAEYGEARLRRFFIDLAGLVERSRADPLVELAVDYPTRLLPEHVAIMRVPGVMSEDTAEREEAWNVIREDADGCVLISELESGVGSGAKTFLQQVREVVPRVLLVLTKVDQAFAQAVERGGTDPWQQVEQARRIGTRRFAREIARDPSEVVSIVVCAEAALEQVGKYLIRRFESEVEELFGLLRHERALILGARAAATIRRCIAGIGEAQERAERAYQERISKLEAERIPEPEDFRVQKLASAEPTFRVSAEQIVSTACDNVRAGFAILRTFATNQLRNCGSKQELLDKTSLLESELADGAAKLRADGHLALENGIDAAVREIEVEFFEELRQQYQLLHRVRRETASLPRLSPISEVSPSDNLVPLRAEVERAITSFGRQRFGLGAGGATVGAAIGTAILPGLGSAAGAAVGLLLGFVRTSSALMRQVVAATERALSAREQAIVEELGSKTDSVTSSIRDALDRSLERAMTRFARWVNEPIEAEREAIERQRANLAALQELEIELQQHDARLESLMRL